jgi:predicted alpha/beta hydrolase family esterase
MELIRAIMLKNGYKARGNGAHEAEVSYLKVIGFNDKDFEFMDKVRYSRNSVTYYGKILDKEYAEIVYEFLLKVYPVLLNEAEYKKRIFIIHRWDGNPKSDWYPWIKNELEKKGFKVEIPSMPNTSEPEINEWIEHIKKIVGKLNNKTYFIGHSIGCQAILRFLEKENYDDKIGKIVFVAGWFGLDNLESKEVEAIAKPWMNSPLNFNKIKQKISKLIVFLSSNEPYGFVEKNTKIFKEKLDAKIILEKNKGHFTEDDGIITLPEILNEIDL